MSKKNIYLFYEWIAEGTKLFGTINNKEFKFVCPCCGNVQTPLEFEKKGLNDYLAFYECIGLKTGGKGTIHNKKKPCNYKIYGVLDLSNTMIICQTGNFSVFDYYIESEKNGKRTS